MKILLVNWQDLHNPAAGGAEIHLFEIFSRLAAKGHQVSLVCSGFPGGVERETISGIEVIRTGDRHSFTLRSPGAIRRALDELQPDVVVDDINKIPLRAPLYTHKPVYVIVPHLFGTTAFQEASWPTAGLVWLSERLIPRVYRNAWFHAISDSTRDDLVDRGIPRDRIAVVYPGVDTELYSPGKPESRASPPRFVYLGRLRRYKGVEYLIEAMGLLREAMPEIFLDIAGSGVDRQRLEELSRARGLTDRIRFLGYVDEATKLRLLRESVGNVFPSPKEGWGITVMEAAACGTPSIASDSPGLRDSVQRGRTGLLVPHGDAAALAEAMIQLARDPGLVERLGAGARTHAEKLTWDTAASAVESHLSSMAETGAPPRFFSVGSS